MNRRKILSKLLGLLLTLAMICSIVPISAKATELYVERKADVVFVIDATGSMGGCISSVKSNITDFVNLISKEDVDVRVKYVIYRDITCSEPTQASGWYSAIDASASYLTDVQATGGGDGPETLLDGIGMMLSCGFRSDAVKYCIFFTDAETKTDNNYGYATEDDAVNAVNTAGIVMSMVTSSALFDTHAKYVSASDGGVIADIYGDYSILLKGLAGSIVGKLDELSGLSMLPRSCKEGEDVTVKVTSTSEITYGDDFKVLFDGAQVEVVSKESTYFEFKVPTDKIFGKYEVDTVNGGVTSKVGNFTIESAAEYGAMTPSATIKGTAVTVKVPVSKLNYQKDFKVTLGGNKVSVSSKQSDYFEFKVPSTLEVKSYDVVITNGGQNAYLGEFVVNPRTPVIGEMTPTECEKGIETIVKVMVSYMDYDSDFSVYMDGKEVTVTKKLADYFKVIIPTDTEVGAHTLNLINGRSSYNLGTFTVKDKEPIIATMGELSQTESLEGTEVVIKVPVTNMEYASDFKVCMNDTEVKVTKQLAGYYKFVIPKTMRAGVYTVTAVNNGINYELGIYTINAKTPTEPQFMGMLPTENERGIDTTVTVNVSDLIYASDFQVFLGTEKMSVTKQLTKYFKFIVGKDFPAGSYDVSIINNGKTYTLGKYDVKEKIPVVENPVFGGMDVTSIEEGKSTTVKVTYSDMEYASDFAVTMNGINMTISKQLAGYFKFEVPAGLLANAYTVKVINNGAEYEIGTFNVTGKPAQTPSFGVMDITSIEEGKSATVKVTYSDMEYASDFAVTMNGTNVTVSKQLADYFKFEVSAGLPANTYIVKVINNGAEYEIGTFDVTGKPAQTPSFGVMDITSIEEGKSATVKVTYSDMEYGTDFAVTMNGINMTISKQLADYFKFEVPAGLPANAYTVKVINNGAEYEIGIFNVTAKPQIIPDFGELQPSASNAGTKQVVKVTKSNLDYESDFAVNLDGNSMEVTKKLAGYFKFTVPASMPAGSYTVTVTNNGNTYTIGTYTIK